MDAQCNDLPSYLQRIHHNRHEKHIEERYDEQQQHHAEFRCLVVYAQHAIHHLEVVEVTYYVTTFLQFLGHRAAILVRHLHQAVATGLWKGI